MGSCKWSIIVTHFIFILNLNNINKLHNIRNIFARINIELPVKETEQVNPLQLCWKMFERYAYNRSRIALYLAFCYIMLFPWISYVFFLLVWGYLDKWFLFYQVVNNVTEFYSLFNHLPWRKFRNYDCFNFVLLDMMIVVCIQQYSYTKKT